MARKVPDFIYWTLFVVLVVMHYFTKTFGAPEHGTVEFFTIIWLASFIGLTALKVWAPEPREEIVDYDENLQRWHLDYIVVGVLGVEAVALAFSALISRLSLAAMWVPTLSFQPYDDILFNIGLVATAEESSKILAIKAFTMKLGDRPGGRIFSVCGPIGFWALLHGYQSYVGAGETAMWLMILAAFICGLIMYWVVKRTRNILCAYIVHSAHNIIVILSSVL